MAVVTMTFKNRLTEASELIGSPRAVVLPNRICTISSYYLTLSYLYSDRLPSMLRTYGRGFKISFGWRLG